MAGIAKKRHRREPGWLASRKKGIAGAVIAKKGIAGSRGGGRFRGLVPLEFPGIRDRPVIAERRSSR